MANFWKKTFTIKGQAIQPRKWLEANWHTYTDPEIAQIFEDAGVPIARAAIQNYRYARGWKKQRGRGDPRPAGSIEMETETESTENPNEREVNAVSGNHTPEALMAECGLDPKDWIVIEFSATRYEALNSHEVKDLEFNSGKLDGTVSRSLEVVPMWRIKMRLQRKNLVPIAPHVTPVQAGSVREVPVAEYTEGAQTALVLADPHIGFENHIAFHDRRVMDLAVQLARESQPGIIAIIGDLLDATMWTDKFLNSPDCRFTTQKALYEAHFWLARLREVCPGSQIIVLEGNHDKRVPNQVQKHLLEAHGLKAATDTTGWPVMSVPYLLDFRGLGMQYISGYPGAEVWLTDDLRLTHGEYFSSAPGGSARANLKNATTSTIFGHAHRFEMASKTLHERHREREIFAACIGCMCRIDGCVPGKAAYPQWQQGFAVVTYGDQSPPPAIEMVKVVDGMLFWRGKQYRSSDRLAELREMFPQTEW